MARPRVTQADAVLDAAALHLASHGLAGTTVDDVAREAGVSRATVYRYVGARDEIVGAVIARETESILRRLEAVIAAAQTTEQLIAQLVTTAVAAVGESPVLHRLSGADLRETLAFITIDSSALVEGVVATISAAIAAEARFGFDDRAIATAVEEATRLILSHLTTPRRNGSRLGPHELGIRAAAMVVPLLESAGRPPRR